MWSVKPAGVVAPPRGNDGHVEKKSSSWTNRGGRRYAKYLSQKSIRDKTVGCRVT
jgi:hypothetical protein